MCGRARSTIAAAFVLVASTARAQGLDARDDAQPSAPPIDRRVHFALDFPGVPGCSERGLFEDALRVRLWQWNPFARVSPWRLEIRVARSLGWFEGTADLYGPDGRYRGQHTMRGPLRCYDVIAGLALAVTTDALPLDATPKRAEPVRSERAPEPECQASRSAVWPTEPPVPPLRAPEPDPPKAPEAPLAFRFGAGVWADLISTDQGSLGLTLDAGVRYRWFSVGGEARWDPAIGSTTYGDYATVRFARVTGALLLCAHHGWFAGCLKGQAGEILFPGMSPPHAPSLYAGAGIRLGLEFPVTPRFLVRLDGELLPSIDRAAIAEQKVTVFEVAGWNAGLGLGALFSVSKP